MNKLILRGWLLEDVERRANEQYKLPEKAVLFAPSGSVTRDFGQNQP